MVEQVGSVAGNRGAIVLQKMEGRAGGRERRRSDGRMSVIREARGNWR